MTDNRTTELREKLKERGVRYQAIGKTLTYWNRDGSDNNCDNADFVADERPDGTLIVEGLTPEQAIAATLGGNACAKCATDMGAYADSLCDPLKERIEKLLRCLENDYGIKASWDGLRKVWFTEKVHNELHDEQDDRERLEAKVREVVSAFMGDADKRPNA